MPDESTAPADLGRSYAAMLGASAWEGDVPEQPASPATEVGGAAPPSPVRIIEALLFVGGAPLTAVRACEIIRGLSAEQFQQAIDELNHAYRRQGRPYAVVPHGQGHALALRPRYQAVAERLFGG